MPTTCETCQFHDEKSTKIAKLEARADGLEGWMESFVEKNDEGHEKILKEIRELRDDMQHKRGAGWMLLKVAGFLAGLAAVVAGLWKAFR